ncbi:MAG: hypothetical protein ACI85O_003374 [Saprospiraceae bacterium]|jgi:hypothetical protein
MLYYFYLCFFIYLTNLVLRYQAEDGRTDGTCIVDFKCTNQPALDFGHNQLSALREFVENNLPVRQREFFA